MKTHPHTTESSLTVAFAELGRLERDRSEVAASKQALRDELGRQGRELRVLRERLEAERPKAIARLRRAQVLRERHRDQLAARFKAEAEVQLDQRLALIQAELETKRLRLAAIETTGSVPRRGRRLLEWSMPVAAAMLVGFMGFTMFDDEAVAQTVPVAVQVPVEPAPAAEPEPEPEPVPVAPVVEPEPEPEPEPVAKPATKPKKKTKKPSKPSETKPAETQPEIKKNSKPLELGDFGGNPLG